MKNQKKKNSKKVWPIITIAIITLVIIVVIAIFFICKRYKHNNIDLYEFAYLFVTTVGSFGTFWLLCITINNSNEAKYQNLLEQKSFMRYFEKDFALNEIKLMLQAYKDTAHPLQTATRIGDDGKENKIIYLAFSLETANTLYITNNSLNYLRIIFKLNKKPTSNEYLDVLTCSNIVDRHSNDLFFKTNIYVNQEYYEILKNNIKNNIIGEAEINLCFIVSTIWDINIRISFKLIMAVTCRYGKIDFTIKKSHSLYTLIDE